MRGRDEVVLRRDLLEPGLELAVRKLDDPVAARADQMMVVPFPAESVAELAAPVTQDVDDTFVAQSAEGPIDGREADPAAPPA